MITNWSNPQTVLFSDGIVGRCQIFVYQGACLAGEPTAYVLRNGQLIWVKPGQSVQWVETSIAA